MKALFGMFVGLLFVLTCDAATINVPADYSTIQAAIDAAVPGDVVVISPGTYTGAGNQDLDFKGKAITVRSTDPNDPIAVASVIINCPGNVGSPHRGFYFHSGETTSSVIDGLTITNGYVRDYGGAVYCYSGSPLIRNCLIKNCKAGSYPNTNAYGGAIFSIAGTVIEKCTIINNTAQGGDGDFIINPVAGNGYGGAIYASSTTTIRDCNLSDNSAIAGLTPGSSPAVAYGGAICGIFNLSNSIVSGNTSDPREPYPAYAGGLYTQGTSSIANCLIKNNACITPATNGNAIWNTGTLSISNCTVYGNFYSSEDPFVAISGSGTGTIINSIIWGNSPGPDVSNMTVSYSCTEDNISGVGNIHSNPLFTTGPLGDFYLSQLAAGQAADSPCVNAGNNSAANLGMNIYTTQTTHKADAGIVDMGYHYPIRTSADNNFDYYVNFADFAFFASDWLTTELRSDLVLDGLIDANDLCVFAGSWLDCYVTQASNPNPADDGTIYTNHLTWSPGTAAISHDVYISTDFNDVDCANRASDEFKGTVSNTIFDPCSIAVGLNYWRVDEVGPACTMRGTVWSFTNDFGANIISCWSLNDANGIIAHDSIGINNGTLIINGPIWTNGSTSGALSFDGVDDYVDCGNNSSLSFSYYSPITISAWVKFNALPDYQTIIAKRGANTSNRGNYCLRTAGSPSNDELCFYYWGVNLNWNIYVTTNANLVTGTWYHVAITHTFSTGSSMKIYLNNTLLNGSWTSGSGNWSPTSNTAPLTIGGLTSGEKLNGIIDDVRLYSRALSAFEIQQLYLMGPQ